MQRSRRSDQGCGEGVTGGVPVGPSSFHGSQQTFEPDSLDWPKTYQM